VANRNHIAVGLDIGSSAVRVLVCVLEDEYFRYLGHGSVPSQGWMRGQIVDQTVVADCICRAVAEAQGRAGFQIGSAVVGAGGPMIRSIQARGTYDFGHQRPIERDDLSYAVELATKTTLEEDRILLQLAPQDFTVDGRPPMPHPLHLECLRLEAHALLMTASAQEHQMLISVANQAHLKVEETVFEGLAAAYAAVLPEERLNGVCLVDIGAQSTNVVIYDGDAMMYATGMPVSGDHFTRDLGELRGLNFDESERLKIFHGCALVGLTADNIIIELPEEGGRPAREVSRRALNEILEARATQMFEMVESRRQRFARDVGLREGIVLSGAASQLEGLVEVAEKVLNCPARIGFPRGIDAWPDDLQSPAWNVAAGLAMYSARLQGRGQKRSSGPSLKNLLPGRR
jgi:cell division protein FtsA